jgi:hypothetical protein
MPTPQSDKQQRSFHLRRLDRALDKTGCFGTALVDPDEELDDTWTGLLVWNIPDGAHTGIVIRCNQGLPAGKWNFCHEDCAIIGDAFSMLEVIQELTNVLAPVADSARS